MINIVDKSKCCGCGACEQVCPAECLSLISDNEGFLYPKVNEDLCIHCDLCEKVCPFINFELKEILPNKVIGAKNPNQEIRKKSSSGGIFFLLAEYVIKCKGVVFGAKFNNNWEVVHSYTETIDGIKPFLGSKYVQSRIGCMFNIAEEYLKKGRIVLFSGTPCQIVGLKKMLCAEYSNLITVAVACHGVPSPKVWKEYKKIFGEKIQSIKFRCKENGQEKLNIKYLDKTGNVNYYSLQYSEDNYIKIFLNEIILRPSCYKCYFKRSASKSDLIIGDFWGINNINPSFNDNKGVSAILSFSEKGNNLLSKINIEYFDTEQEKIFECNGGFSYITPIHPNRTAFFKNLNKINLDVLIYNTINKLPIKYRIKRKIRNIFNKYKKVLDYRK